MTTADPARNEFDPAAAAAAKRGRAQQALLALSNSWLFVFLLLLIGWFWLTTPPDTFLSHSNLTQIALSTSEVVLLAIGQTFVIVTAGIDLSIGGIVFLSGVCGGEVMLKLSGTTEQVVTNGQYPHASLGIAVGVLVCVLTGAVCGLGNGLVDHEAEAAAVHRHARHARHHVRARRGDRRRLVPARAGPARPLAGVRRRQVPRDLLPDLGRDRSAWSLAHIAFVYTRFGRYTRAVGSNEEARAPRRHLRRLARHQGLRARRHCSPASPRSSTSRSTRTRPRSRTAPTTCRRSAPSSSAARASSAVSAAS